ncbi:MAG TPA: hypothetical protein VKS81_03880 [Bacteroidota bacterium]|nr:hypothetical protein [Bacteroidota bacterium]
MKSFRTAALTFALLVSTIAALAGEKPVFVIYALNETVFAGTPDGVYASADSGKSWQHLNTNFTSNAVHCFVSIENVLYAGTESGVYQTSNGGRDWKISDPSFTENIHALWVNDDDNNIFAGTDHGLFRSGNRGASWKSSGSKFLDRRKVYDVSYAYKSIQTLINKDIYATTDSITYRSVDDGKLWESASFNHSSKLLYDFWELIFASADSDLWVSFDNGQSWQPSPFKKTVHSMTSHRKVVFAGTDADGVYFTKDGGITWKPLFTAGMNKTVLSLYLFHDRLFASTPKGIYSTDDDGVTWSPRDAGIP